MCRLEACLRVDTCDAAALRANFAAVTALARTQTAEDEPRHRHGLVDSNATVLSGGGAGGSAVRSRGQLAAAALDARLGRIRAAAAALQAENETLRDTMADAARALSESGLGLEAEPPAPPAEASRFTDSRLPPLRTSAAQNAAVPSRAAAAPDTAEQLALRLVEEAGRLLAAAEDCEAAAAGEAPAVRYAIQAPDTERP